MQFNVVSTPHLRRIGWVVIVASLAAISYATLLPAPGQPVTSHLCLVCGTLGVVDVVLNVLLFVPLGVGLALYGIPAKRAILIMSMLSLSIETAQFFVISGRDASIGDVLTNTFGGALGFVVSRYAGVWLRPTPRNATSFIVGWCAIWLGIQVVSSSAFAASIPQSRYYGELAPLLEDFAVFHGRVLSPRIDGIAIPNTAFADSRRAQRHLLLGGTVSATVLPAEVTAGLAPIVRVADAEQNEILLLAQSRTDLVFAVRSRAAAFRLRPPVFALANVFPTAATEGPVIGDTLAVSGRYLAHEVRMTARTASKTQRSLVSPTASLGWTLVWPSQWFIDGTPAERVISGVWIASLVLPFGYWASFRAKQPSTQNTVHSRTLFVRASIAIIWGGLALVGGLAIAPVAFGLSATPMVDWLAALSGVLLGAGLANRTIAWGPTRVESTWRAE